MKYLWADMFGTMHLILPSMLLTACAADPQEAAQLEAELQREASLTRQTPSYPPVIEPAFISDAYDIPSRQTLADDTAYLLEAARDRGSKRVGLDYSDDDQYRAILHRLARAGRTPDRDPVLHTAIASRRARALERLARGEEPTAVLTTGYNHMHALDTTTYLQPYEYAVASNSTLPAGEGFYVDVTFEEVADCDGDGYTEWCERGYADLISTTSGKTLMVKQQVTMTGENPFRASSFAIQYNLATGESVSGNDSISYDEADVIVPAPTSSALTKTVYGTIALDHPSENGNDSDTTTKLCTQRSSTTGCEYYYSPGTITSSGITAGDWYVLGTKIGNFPGYPYYYPYMALQGSADFSKKMDTITEHNKLCTANTTGKSECFNLLLEDKGSCFPVPDLSKIWAIGGSKLYWDSLHTAWGTKGVGEPVQMDGATGCSAYNVLNAMFWQEVKVKGRSGSGPLMDGYASQCYGGSSTSTNACYNIGTTGSWSMQVVKSCIAAGSQVRLASGQTLPIETITSGQVLQSDGAGQVLTVTDRTIGSEDIPMVRILDAEGHSLLLTEGHAVPTASRGLLEAGDLTPSDLLFTEDGITAIISVSSEWFDGTVHNLTLGNERELKGLDPDRTTMVVNGIVVGDERMQHRLNEKVRDDLAFDALRKGLQDVPPMPAR